MGHSQAGDVHVEAEEVTITDTTIAGDCVFSGPMLIVGDLTIADNVRFEQSVMVAPGAKITINGRALVPKPPPKPKD